MYTFIKVFHLFELVRFGLVWYGLVCVYMALYSLLPFLSIIQIDIFINVWCLIHTDRITNGPNRMANKRKRKMKIVFVFVCTAKRSWSCWCAIANSHTGLHIRPLSDSEFSTRIVVFHMPISMMMIMNGTHIVWPMIRVENPGVRRYGWQKKRAGARAVGHGKECGRCQPNQQINYEFMYQ